MWFGQHCQCSQNNAAQSPSAGHTICNAVEQPCRTHALTNVGRNETAVPKRLQLMLQAFKTVHSLSLAVLHHTDKSAEVDWQAASTCVTMHYLKERRIGHNFTSHTGTVPSKMHRIVA